MRDAEPTKPVPQKVEPTLNPERKLSKLQHPNPVSLPQAAREGDDAEAFPF